MKSIFQPELIQQGGQPVRDQEPHFLTVLPQRVASYAWAHMNNTPCLHYRHTYLCSARFIV